MPTLQPLSTAPASQLPSSELVTSLKARERQREGEDGTEAERRRQRGREKRKTKKQRQKDKERHWEAQASLGHFVHRKFKLWMLLPPTESTRDALKQLWS